MDDVRNLIARLKNRGVELSDDDAVVEMILDFNHESPRNVSSVHRSTNQYSYQLLTIVGMDQWFSRGRLSQQELTDVELPFVAKVYKRRSAAASGGLSGTEKYRRAQQAFGCICGEMARLDGADIESAMTQLDQWWYNLRQGRTSLPQPATEHNGDTDQGDGSSGSTGGVGSNEVRGTVRDHDDDSEKRGSGPNDGSNDETPTQISRRPPGNTQTVANLTDAAKIPKVRRAGKGWSADIKPLEAENQGGGRIERVQ
ncbi:hypothetical protein PI126_g8725 [Phytophthora idaei]|nr:hypothetical protein PI126_g8725 [Phytophthora idaei]